MKKYLLITATILSLFVIAGYGCFAQQNIGIGGAPDRTAKVDIQSTNSGLLMPRLTRGQRDSILSPAEGLAIYNLDCHKVNIYNGNAWVDMIGNTLGPSSPAVATNNASQTQIIWRWRTAAGATGYKWNTTNNYGSATAVTDTSYTQTGLSCNSYTLYVWAYNNCGNSSATILSQSITCFSCGSPVTFTYNGGQVTYGTVAGSYNGGQYCWLDRNLGATEAATNVNDHAAYGDKFQWGRADDGHQIPYSSTTGGPTTNPNPGSNFITGNYTWYSGTTPGPDDLWQNGLNNPCPSGFRLPTKTEMENEVSAFSPQDLNGAFGSPLKLPAADIRVFTGSLLDRSVVGYYWTSTPGDANDCFLLDMETSSVVVNAGLRAYGMSVRCILGN